MGVVIAVLVLVVTVLSVKYIKLKQTQTGYGPNKPHYENQAGSRLPQVQSSASSQHEAPRDERLHSNHTNGNTGTLHGHSTDSNPCEDADDLNGCTDNTDNTPYENPDDLNLQCSADNSPCENSGDVNLNSPTDNSPYENPEAMTSKYLTISESGNSSSRPLNGQYENVNGRGNQYQTIDMVDIFCHCEYIWTDQALNTEETWMISGYDVTICFGKNSLWHEQTVLQ